LAEGNCKSKGKSKGKGKGKNKKQIPYGDDNQKSTLNDKERQIYLNGKWKSKLRSREITRLGGGAEEEVGAGDAEEEVGGPGGEDRGQGVDVA
jgi:hypothetical protein